MKPRSLSFAVALLLLGCLAPAAAESAEGDCNGIDFDLARPLAVAKIVAKPRVHFVKSAWEDKACPADTEACRAKAYLVPDDLVLAGRTRGPLTCVAYQSPRDRKQNWTNGWIASTALRPVAPMATKPSDWLGTWKHAGGTITIGRARNGMLSIKGEHVYPAALNVHTGVIGAEAKPSGAYLSFAEDGTVDFESAEEGACRVRMQRIGALLAVEDNTHCGGSMVTFTGLYRRER